MKQKIRDRFDIIFNASVAAAIILSLGTPADGKSILGGKIPGIGKGILGGGTPSSPGRGSILSGVGGLSDEQQKVYDKLVQAANAIAVETYAHENPTKVGGSGPKDPFTDLLQVKLVVQEIKECQDAAAAALGAGIPGGTPVQYVNQGSSLVSPTPLSDMSAKVCGKYQQVAEATYKSKYQQANGERDRFLNLLSGDRKSVFAEYNMHKRAVKGSGGRNLLQPQDFVRASTWSTYGNVADSYPERWYVHSWFFSGNKLLREANKEGWGHNPPSSAFP